MAGNHDILDAGLAHLQKLIAGGLKPIECQAWERTLYCGPLTPEQREAIQLAAKQGDAQWAIEVLIQRARDESGARVFHPADKPTMRRMLDMQVVAELALAIDDAWRAPSLDESPDVKTAKN